MTNSGTNATSEKLGGKNGNSPLPRLDAQSAEIASARHHAGIKITALNAGYYFFFRPAWFFLRRYILQGRIFGGAAGLADSVHFAMTEFSASAKLYELDSESGDAKRQLLDSDLAGKD